MTDIIGTIKLILFVMRHPIGTYKFMKDVRVLIRVLSLDVFGNVAPLYQKNDLLS